jgi:hypothetical protein
MSESDALLHEKPAQESHSYVSWKSAAISAIITTSKGFEIPLLATSSHRDPLCQDLLNGHVYKEQAMVHSVGGVDDLAIDFYFVGAPKPNDSGFHYYVHSDYMPVFGQPYLVSERKVNLCWKSLVCV